MLMRLFLAAFAVLGVHSQALIELELKNVSVQVGVDVTIPCAYKTDITTNPSMRWYRGFGNNQRERIALFEKASDGSEGKSVIDSAITRNVKLGPDGELILVNTTLDDNKQFGTLFCDLDFGTHGSNQGKLNFLVYVEAMAEPQVNLDKTEFPQSTQKTRVGSCKTGFGYPDPEIYFYRGSTLITSSATNGSEKVSTDVTGDFSMFLTRKTVTPNAAGTMNSVNDYLSVILTKADDEAPFFCLVKSGDPANPKIQNVSFPIFRVAYPTDDVTVTANSMKILEDTQVTLTCKSNGYPEATISDFEGQTSNTIQVEVNRDDDNKVFSCTAGNQAAEVTGSYTMKVLYMDTPVIEGPSVVSLGETISLTCNANSNQDEVMYTWAMNTEMVGEGATYTITADDFDEAGTFTCTAKTAAGSEGMVTHSVAVNGIKKPTSEVTCDQENDQATFTCEVVSIPAPKFVWSREGSDEPVESEEPLSLGDNKYKSVLTVGPIDSSFKGAKYVCAVTNGISDKSSVATFDCEIQPEGSPVAGIVIGILVALLVIAVIVAVLYNKGIICKSGEKGDENAEDIAVEINKDDVESGHKAEDQPEEEKLVNGDN